MESLKRHRVMLVSPDFGPGGSEHSISKLSVQLSKSCDVYFVVFNKQRQPAFPYSGTLHSLDVLGGRSFVGKLLRFRDRVRKLRQLKKQLQIETSISFLEGANYVNVLSSGDEKTVVSVRGSHAHDGEIRGLLGWIRKSFLMPWCFTRADHVVAVSRGVAGELEREMGISPEQISVIHNSYSIDAIVAKGREPVDPAFEKLFDRPVIIAAGRLHPQKNYKALLGVASGLKKDGVSFRLIILGEGQQRNELVAASKALGLITSSGDVKEDAEVIFGGYQTNPWSLMARAQVFVLSSSWEGFPNVLAEAMCLGLPVVSTDCPHGPREILDAPMGEACGVLIPELADDHSIRSAIKEIKSLLANPALRHSMGKAAQERMKKFSEDSAIEKWLQLIGS